MKTVLRLCLTVLAVFIVGIATVSAEPIIFDLAGGGGGDAAVHGFEFMSAGVLGLGSIYSMRHMSMDDGGSNPKAFVAKTAAELGEMDAEGLAGYYNEKNSHMWSEVDRLRKEDSEKHEKAIETLKEDLDKERDLQVKNLNKVLINQGLAIKRMSTAEKETSKLSFVEQMKAGLTDNKEKLAILGGDEKSSAKDGEFSFKVVGDMTIIGNISGGNVPVEQREAGVNNIARRRTFVLDLVARGVASSNIISWVEQTGVEGGAAGTVEGVAKNQADFDLVVVSESVKKRTVFIKVSTEMLDDIDFMASEINNELIQLLLLDVDDQVLNGNNVGQNLNGIVTLATAFAGGVFAGTVDLANSVDVLTVAANQIEIAEHMPNYILMHPSDITALKLVKMTATDKRYIDRLITVAGNMNLDGIPIIKNTGVTQGDYVIGDFSKSAVFDKGSVGVDVGLDGNDFTKNMRTIIAEWRGLNRIKGNDTTAFVTGTLATDAAVLETP